MWTPHLDVRVQTIDIENAEEIFAVAPPPGTLRVGRYFTALLLLLAVLYSIVALGGRHTPKLGIDLVGGKRVIFTARTTNGKAPSSNSMSQARQILEDRVNGQGVTGATVQVQGGNQLLVLIPGGTSTDVKQLGEPAVLNFRGLVAPAAAVSCVTGKAAAAASPTTSTSATPTTSPTTATSSAKAPAKSNPSSTARSSAKTASNAPNDAAARPLAVAPTPAKKTPTTARTTPTTARTTPTTRTSAAKATGTATGEGTPSATVAPSATASAAATPCSDHPFAALFKANPKLTLPTTEAAFTALTTTQQTGIQSALASYNCKAAENEKDVPTHAYIACDDGTDYGTPVAYLLGKVIVPGHEIDSASSQAPSTGGNGGSTEWTVSLTLKGSGSSAWGNWTGKYNTGGSTSTTISALSCGATTGTPCSDFVGFTLNGEVISAPVTQSAINGGATQISGNFDQSSADALAKELNYGALPLSFRADDNESVSATLGSQQLRGAFEAGGIGLALVVIYSLLYYRGLGLVTIASLIVSAGLTYALLVLLGTQIGFTLDLAGIAGFIVALGITADSFVVFFERIKDEVHEGRSMRVAVPRAWIRARRTVLSADTVSFLAAAILYYFASADVKGFAFTLGLSTILDLVVVFLFTHPIVSVLSRSRAFGSPRFTGLNAVRVGGFDVDEPAPRGKRSSGTRSAGRKPAQAPKSKSITKPVTQKAPVAVIDDDADVVDADVFDDDESPTVIDDNSTNDDGSDFSDETVDTLDTHDTADAAEIEDTDVDDEPRRSTTPEPGSAAERAAARRARMRAQKDQKGDS